eukprot:jgi/Ulvmu1/4727/UM020_0011.1
MFGDYDAQAPSSDTGGYASQPPSSVFRDYDTPAPSNMSTGDVPAELPSNLCPTSADIEEAGPSLAAFASLFRKLFETDASGQPIPADLEDITGFLDDPNTYQWLTAFLEDHDRLAEYVSNNCASKTIKAPESTHFFPWVDSDDFDLFIEQDDFSQVQCVDTFGAIGDFLRNFESMLLACDPPFGVNPDCFSSAGHNIVTSPTCATAYARLFNVSDVTALASIAATVIKIQDACSAVTNEAECFAADTPVLGTINDLHNDIPVLWPLNFAFTPGPVPPEPTPPTPPDCFNASCQQDLAHGPEAAPPGGGPLMPDVLPAPTSDAPTPTAPPGVLAEPGGTDAEGSPEGFELNPPVSPLASGAAPVAMSAVATAAVLLPMLLR